MSAKKPPRSRVELAYISYALVCPLIWFEPIAKILPIDPDFGQLLFMLLWVPVLVGTVVVVVSALLLSLSEWRVWQLPTMALALALMIIVFLGFDERGMGDGEIEPTLYFVGTGIIVLLCAWHFLVERLRSR